MAYGSVAGLRLRIPRYDTFLTQGTFTAETVGEARSDADSLIDTRLASVIDSSYFPLTSAAVDAVSNDLTACYLLAGRYVDKDRNESEWVINYCKRGEKRLEDIIKNPDLILSDIDVESFLADSNTRGQDREFSMETRIDGVVDETGTMDDW